MSLGGQDRFDPVKAMAVTRPLVVEEMVRRLGALGLQLDDWDPECDRALSEMWWLTRWIEGRVARNEGNRGMS